MKINKINKINRICLRAADQDKSGTIVFWNATPRYLSGRTTVAEETIKCWFREFLKDKDFTEMIDHPGSIFKNDESGFALCPKTEELLYPKG